LRFFLRRAYRQAGKSAGNVFAFFANQEIKISRRYSQIMKQIRAEKEFTNLKYVIQHLNQITNHPPDCVTRAGKHQIPITIHPLEFACPPFIL
jgi:hypothetical protein